MNKIKQIQWVTYNIKVIVNLLFKTFRENVYLKTEAINNKQYDVIYDYSKAVL